MRIEVERLIKQAERDLESVRKNIGIEAFEVAAFLAEQAAYTFLIRLIRGWVHEQFLNARPSGG